MHPGIFTFVKIYCSPTQVHGIPSEVVFTWDQTGLNIVPTCNWTTEERGAHKIVVEGMGDKRQITATFAGTLSGGFLPIRRL
jgi:hypothetical protein